MGFTPISRSMSVLSCCNAYYHASAVNIALDVRCHIVMISSTMRWYIKSRNYSIGTLVAFSGDVNDNESGPDTFTEHSKTLNPDLKGRDIRDAGVGNVRVLRLVSD
jgi:type I restriction enzyme, R subunit